MTLPVRRSSGSSGQTEQRRPFREFEDLFTEMDRLVQSVIGGSGDGTWMPAGDVVETDNEYIVELELPGVRSEDIDVRVEGNELVVRGELKERKREGLFRRRTRRVGDFEYRVMLPGELREQDIQASLAYGVLRIEVPKAQNTGRSNRIAISESGDGSGGSKTES
ncbi:MAG: putative heat shock protein [Mycobacterium sp.]|jgi:HSP20 family protein|nr:putative heat shock protein [Mycobacterium sp.]